MESHFCHGDETSISTACFTLQSLLVQTLENSPSDPVAAAYDTVKDVDGWPPDLLSILHVCILSVQYLVQELLI